MGVVIDVTGSLIGQHPRSFRCPRSRLVLIRQWNSLSNFQRSLLILSTVFAFIFVSIYLMLSALASSTSENAEHSLTVNEVVKFRTDAQSQSSRSREPINSKFKGPKNDRQKAIVNAFRHAWSGYRKFAFGHDHLLPISKSYDNWFNLGLTIVDSIDTMILMNLHEEFNESKRWIESSLNFDQDVNVNLFETTIRVLGGLLSAYHLNNKDELFLTKAQDLGRRLLGAFDTPLHIPYSDVNLKTKVPKLPSWTADGSLSEISSIQLEFRDLSRVTGDSIYEDISFNVSKMLHALDCTKYNGLCPMYISPKTGEFRPNSVITMGARTDSYYEYLLKQYLQTGQKIRWLRNDYQTSVIGVMKHLVGRSNPSKLTFIGELLSEGSFSPKMDHLVCFYAGTLALGHANNLPNSKSHLELAEKLANTCFQMYNVTATGLGPEIAFFNMAPTSNDSISVSKENDIFIKTADSHSLLRPEALEAFYYLYKITGRDIYRDFGWTIFQSIEKYAKVENGYSSVSNVKKVPVTYQNKMESFFLAETLKYLYLLFDDDDILSLKEYVFNTEAHPLPIRDF